MLTAIVAMQKEATSATKMVIGANRLVGGIGGNPEEGFFYTLQIHVSPTIKDDRDDQ